MALAFKNFARQLRPLLSCFKRQGTNSLMQLPKPVPITSQIKSHVLSSHTVSTNTLHDLHYPPYFYWPLEPRKNGCGDDQYQHRTKISNSFLRGFPKSFNIRRKTPDEKKDKKRVPKLILLQNPFTWLMVKLDFGILRTIWDPAFREKEFKFGSKQAISRITQVISAGNLVELNGLLTKPARSSLTRELDRSWGERQRSLLALDSDDIQISSPRKVYFIRIADKKYCDVDMAFLALKWAPINSIEVLIFTEIFARFHREYTPHCIPEWTIAYFKVTRFEVLRR